MAAKDPRPGPRNLDAARLIGHYRTMLRIRAFEEAALKGLDEKLVLAKGADTLAMMRELFGEKVPEGRMREPSTFVR